MKKCPQKPRSNAEKIKLTKAINERREKSRGFLYEWLESAFVFRMQGKDKINKPWKKRSDAAQELTNESTFISGEIKHALPLRRNKNGEIEIDSYKDAAGKITVDLIDHTTKPLANESVCEINKRGKNTRKYSISLYRKIVAWEKKHKIKYPTS